MIQFICGTYRGLSMITVKLRKDENIEMSAHFAYRKRCAAIPGAVFNRTTKTWIMPKSSLRYILKNFKGELFFKTPLWKIKGEEKPIINPLEFNYIGREVDIPNLALEPYEYQEAGIKFMIDRLNNIGFCINGDKVGLGKTLQSLAALKWYMENRGVRKALIICKKSLKAQWQEETPRITGIKDMLIEVTGDTKRKRQKAYDAIKASNRGILITNYQSFLNDSKDIYALNFDFYIIDEAHCVKHGKMNKNISEVINSKPTILLTGTPILSSPEDVHGIVSLANKKYLGTYDEFEKKYLVIDYGIYGRQIIGVKNLDTLKEKLNLVYISRTASQVFAKDSTNDNTPPKVMYSTITVTMDEVQKKMYDYIYTLIDKLDAEKEELISSHGINDITQLAIDNLNDKGKQYLASLQYVSNDAACINFTNQDVLLTKSLKKLLPGDYQLSQKTEETLALIEEIISSDDDKVIVFCHYASTAKMLKAWIKRAFSEEVLLYTGEEREDERTRNIELFKTSEDYKILIATEAAAEGLNLQVVKYMIHYEQADTYAQKHQRIGRIARIGSPYKAVISYDIITENSRDSIKIKKIGKDKKLATAILE